MDDANVASFGEHPKLVNLPTHSSSRPESLTGGSKESVQACVLPILALVLQAT
jgi:hypothetical protein